MKKSRAFELAKAAGQKTYVPEQPCTKGHVLRSVSSRSCVECRRISESARVAKNREAHNARKAKERSKHLPVLAERARHIRANEAPAQRAARLEKARIAQQAWRAKNKGRESIRVAKQAYKARKPEKGRADTVKRRAFKMQRTPAWLTPDDFRVMEQAYELAQVRTKMFGFAWHVDHKVPLQGKAVSGLHTPVNLQVIPGVENISKANKWTAA